MKQNCWEYKKCGREENGTKTDELGVCPASTAIRYDGAHGGKNAGRKCWHVNETLCDGAKQGAFYTKAANCVECDFFQLVREEEGVSFGY